MTATPDNDTDELDGAVARAARMNAALAHDYLLVLRGAERTFAVIADLYASAPLYTLLYDEAGTGGRFAAHSLHTSPLQRLGVRQRGFRALLPLYPFAVRRLRPDPCAVVVSSSSAFAHGLAVPPGAVHVCYCHAPFRYAWYEQARALSEAPSWLAPALRAQLAWMRRWDVAASRRVDAYVANSQLTRERIRRFYGRDAPIIHPPVETERFSPGEAGASLLVVCELVRHKRVHVALEAARMAGVPITVVGDGPERGALEQEFPQAHFAGRTGDKELAQMYAQARAVIVPSPEEFGITAVEAQAAGRPVIGAATGGLLETVIEGETGLHARLDDPADFARAIRDLEQMGFDPARSAANAERFSVAAFRRRLASFVEEAVRAGGEPEISSGPQ